MSHNFINDIRLKAETSVATKLVETPAKNS